MSSLEMSSFVSVVNLPENVGFATFFNRLFEMRCNTDVDFALLGPDGPVTFSAHKMILSMWSPIFADKFYYGKRNKVENVVNIVQCPNANPEAFEAMLRFMYGSMPHLQDTKKACDLYRVAREFEINKLQNTCRQFLNEVKVEPTNVFDILEASNYMRNQSRTDTCLKLIQEKTQEVMETFDLSGLSTSMLNFFLDLPVMSLSGEYDLLKWVFSWAKVKCKDSNLHSDVREVLEPFLFKLNFLALTNEEFAMFCAEWPNFFSSDEIVSIFMNIGVKGSKKMPDWYDENRPFRVYNESSRQKVASNQDNNESSQDKNESPAENSESETCVKTEVSTD